MGSPAIIRNIIILGPKHSGKTCTGRELAKLLGSSFIDLDELIEAQTGKSPRALFKESPEVFRTAELQALEILLPRQPAGDPPQSGGPPPVIAAGGGITDNSEARDLLLTEGIFLVNLEVSAETAWERISVEAERSGEMPPFLNTENPGDAHRQIHERRAAACREIARLTVSGEGKTPVEIGMEILTAVVIQLQGIR